MAASEPQAEVLYEALSPSAEDLEAGGAALYERQPTGDRPKPWASLSDTEKSRWHCGALVVLRAVFASKRYLRRKQ